MMISDCTYCSLFALVKIIGDSDIANSCGWYKVEREDIKSLKDEVKKNELTDALYPMLVQILINHKIPMKGISDINVSELELKTFEEALKSHIIRIKEKATESKRRKAQAAETLRRMNAYSNKKSSEELYDKFEYGLSDW